MSTIVERLAAKAIPDPGPTVAPTGIARGVSEHCRAPYNHDWDESESQRNPQGGGWYLTMRCTKCATVFKQIVNPDGSLYGGRKYNYPNGYKDELGWDRSAWRLNYLNKLNGHRR